MSVSCHRLVTTLRGLGRTVDVAVLGGGGEGSWEVEELHRDRGMEFRLPPSLHPATAFHLLRHAVAGLARKGEGAAWVVGFGANLPGLFAVSLEAWTGMPAAVMVRGNDLDRDWFDPKRAPWVREALSRARLVTAVSREKVEVIRRLFPGARVEFLPNGVDPRWWEPLPRDLERARELRSSPALAQAELVVGLLGEIKEKKGLPLLLRAIRRGGLLSRVSLLTVGRLDGPSQALLDDPVLSPSHLHLPFVPREELAGVYGACDLVVIPSLYDGMPNVMLEAMACGVPVAASTAGGMVDVLEDGVTGLLFRPGSWEELARCLGRALELGREGLAAMGRRAQAVVKERFPPEAEARGLLSLLERAR